LQEDIINSILSGKDTLALMPTGGGKSICYQVPALAMEGLCLVISPLIALMKDQVENLRRKNITAFAIYSGMSRKEVIQTLKVAGESNCKFLYVSPERLETNLFKEYLHSLGISLIAVDEAHCISQWGYDFRPPYLRIAALREELPNIPILALTASATEIVQNDICEKLRFSKSEIFRQSFERANLSYSVFQVDSKMNKILDIIQKVNGSGLVYTRSRRRTKEISELLVMHGISADFYHAGLSQEERNTKQEGWISNKIRIMVCTNAFGMGIDKPDVRVVVHADLPDCLENYYQEAGRAGRDGKRSYAVLLYQSKESEDLKALVDTKFPSMEVIRSTYQSLMNYIQLPSGAGENSSFDFDLPDFTKKFKIPATVSVAVLQTLEQEGLLSYSDQIFIPSKVGFTTSKDSLYAFEKDHPESEDLIKTLLRTYAGIFDYPANINEKSLAFQLKIDQEKIKTDLIGLHQSRLINYQPAKEKPQLYFLTNRPKTEDLYINSANYLKRKLEYAARIESMLGYVKEKKVCRSQQLAIYFGDKSVKECGICDNCLDSKKGSLGPEEFERISNTIINSINQEAKTSSQLLQSLNAFSKEKAWKVIDFLQAENKIEVDKNGLIRKR
jgi:ATP-dependent DNA helicase RecQ